jgi:hypothetical protein
MNHQGTHRTYGSNSSLWLISFLVVIVHISIISLDNLRVGCLDKHWSHCKGNTVNKLRMHGARKKEWGQRKTREAGLERGGAASKKAGGGAKFVAFTVKGAPPFILWPLQGKRNLKGPKKPRGWGKIFR